LADGSLVGSETHVAASDEAGSPVELGCSGRAVANGRGMSGEATKSEIRRKGQRKRVCVCGYSDRRTRTTDKKMNRDEQEELLMTEDQNRKNC
jgi:hypothetical protein